MQKISAPTYTFAGTLKPGEVAFRCPACGDSSKNPTKAHASVNMTSGLWYCFRCGAGGKLSPADLLMLSTGQPGAVAIETRTLPTHIQCPYVLAPGAASARHSCLDRYHVMRPDGPADAFLCRSALGEPVGVYVRLPNTTSRLYGTRGFGFVGEKILSSARSPIRLVEGPYDCVTSRDVCLFGFPSVAQLKQLTCQYVILCPDGDVWANERLLRSYITTFSRARTRDGLIITAIEKLPPAKDPDEVPVHERDMLAWDDVVRLIRRPSQPEWSPCLV